MAHLARDSLIRSSSFICRSGSRLWRAPWVSAVVVVAVAGTAGVVHAKPVAPALFCATYPDAAVCDGAPAACMTCHITTSPVVMNDFGEDVKDALAQYASVPFADGDFEEYLAQALMDIEDIDSDGDGFGNLEEIERGTEPGQADSYPIVDQCPSPDQVAEHDYKICTYDYGYVYRKVGIDFCGLPPTFAEMEAFHELGEAEQQAELHAQLDRCLDSEFWLGPSGVLWNVAHRKVRPVGSLSGFADYTNDYDYFTYTQIDDHDVRELLVGQYLVERVEAGTPEEPRSVYQVVATRDGQPMQPERRAGLLTSAWPLFYNTMFTALPRGTAAQAYRAFLGFDIAASEGLSWPIAGEPVDYDLAGVTEATCAGCHSTLDPLSYPFSRYNGLQNDGVIGFYEYDPDRIAKYFVARYPLMANMPEAGYLMGQPVADLLQWAQVAVASDRFFSATVSDYWRLLIGEPPTAENAEAYAEHSQLWQQLAGHYSVEQMLHGLIDTEAYGAP